MEIQNRKITVGGTCKGTHEGIRKELFNELPNKKEIAQTISTLIAKKNS